MFNENSGLVQIWIRLIQTGEYSINDVPSLSNLKEIINSMQISNNDQAQKAEAFDLLIGNLEENI